MPNNDWLRAMTGIAPDKEPAQDVGDPGEHYYNPEWDRGQSLENDPLALFNHQQTLKRMLRESANPVLFAQGVDDITKVRMTIDSAKQPEPVSIWEPLATELRASAATFGGGLLAIPAALASIPHVITGADGDSPFIALTEKARAHYDAASDERSEQAQRNAEAGGGRVKMIVGSLIGQAPEMLATGFGATSAVKSLFQMGTKAALTTAQLKNAFMVSTAVQGGMEGVKNTVGRMAENVAAGEEALQASDVAAGLAIAAVTMFTEIPGGMRGEYRALSQGGWRAKASEAAKDFILQPGQEAFQEGATQIINDLADGSYINWSEVGWSALAGAIGGGMFAVPGAVSALTSHATDPIAAAEIVRVATAAAKAPDVIRHSEAVAAAVGKAAATPEIAKQSETTLRQLFQSDTGGNIHMTLDDFKIIAGKRGSSVESLLIEMGGNAGGGDVAIPTENFMANMVKNSPELMEEAKTMIKQDAGSPSRKDLADIIDAMESLKQRKFEDLLPDGKTADDSQKIVAEMTAETVTAAAVSKAKLTDAQVRTAAELAAVQFRTAAIQWNTAYEAQGKTERVTPKQLYDKYRAQITGLPGSKSGTTMSQDVADKARGEYDYVSKIILLGADANTSTIHHELMHHWLEVTKSWASDPSAPDVFRQNLTDIGAWASKNAGKVASVYKKVSGKEVSTEDIVAAAADMGNLNLNSQAGKAIHEAVAYGYEQYLTEGKAPTKELKRIFKQIANYFNKIIKQLMRSEILTDPALTKVFDRMLTASDAKAIAHLTPQAIEASGMSAEMATLLNGLYGEQLADAQQQAYAKVLEQVKKDYEVELLAKAEEIKSTLMTQPVYKAQAGMATKPMDAEKVKSILAGTEHTGIDLSLYTTDKGGADPLAARDEYGFTGSPLDMLIELSASKPVNTVARDGAEAAFDAENRMSPADMAQEIIDSDTGSLMIAAAELRALRASAKVSGQAAKEATAAGKEATKEAVAVSTAELKTKIKQMADKAKMDKQTHDEALTNFKNWINSIGKSGLSLEAQKRLDADPMTVEAIAKQIAATSANAIKLASRDQLEAAFREQVEVATLTEMQRILDRTAADTAAADIADTVSLLKRDIKNDVRILAAWAKEVVRRMPMADLNPGVWARRVEAARSRREVAAAKGDKDGIKKASEDIVYSLAMQHEILRTAAVRQEMTASLIKHTTAKELQYLADAGYPMVKIGNEIRVFSTMEEAEAAAYTGPHGTQVTRTTDLHDIGRSIAGILSSKREVQVAAVQALESLTQSNPGLIIPEVQRMLADGKISVNYAADFVKSFTTDDFAALTAQVVFLRNEAKARPSVTKEQGKLIADGVNAIPKDAVKQTENMFYRFMFHTMKNVTLHLHVLGDFGKKIVAKMDDSSTNEMEYKRQVAKILSPAQTALHKSGIDMDERKTILGVDTSRHEDLVRLLMLGTKTGRQRVIADLAMRSKDVNANQYIATISQVTDVEAAWLSAMWEANDLMWSWDVAAAKANGIPLPKTLEATPVPVIVGDKIVGLRGGYASVPYVGSEGPAFEMLTDSMVKPADVARGLYLDREEVVEGHRLDLTSEAQTRSQISHMRTAAFLGLATDMRVLLANDSPFSINATEKLGKGWVADFKQYLQFTVAGVKPSTHFERGFQFLGFAQQLAVFGFNITTAVSQLTGVIGSMGHPKIGPKAMLGASGRILSEMIGNWSVAAPFQRIGSQSVEMLHRPGGQSLDILSIDKIEGKQTFAGKFRDWGTAPMRRMQQVVDTITYQAAYDRAIAELPADLKGDMRLAAAKRIATDAVKETQGTALRSRQSEIAHTQMGVCFTFAGKWMMNNANWLATLYYDSKRQGWKGGKSDFAVAVMTSVLAATAAMIALRAVLQPEDDDDEQRDLQDYATKWAIDSLAQPHYLGRYVAHVAQLMVTEQTWNRPVDTLPQLSQFTSGASMVINQMKDSQDSDDVQKIIAGLIGMGSIVPGVPSVQLKRSTDALFSGAKDGWKDPWETFVQSVFGADRVPRIAD